MVGVPFLAGLKGSNLSTKMTNITVQGLGIFLYVSDSLILKLSAR
jgi:hypothetical protein